MSSPPTISAVIPARNSEQTLPFCLEAIRKSSVPIHEIIVVSDGSTDRTCEISGEHHVTLHALRANHQANYCRNLGAAEAHGEFILFLDSDVVLAPDALHNALQTLEDPQIDAVVGIYSEQHRNQNASSQYKNLWIRYSYLRASESVDWIFGAIAVVRREAFQRAGGFDHTLFMHQGGDLELGKRITQKRPAIRFNPAVEVEHLKKHTLVTLLKNDYERSKGFTQLAARLGQFPRSLIGGFVNVYPAFAYSALLSWGVLLLLLAGLWSNGVLWLALAGAAGYLALNFPFLRYYFRTRTLAEAPAVMGIMILDHLICGIGCLKGISRWTSPR